MYFLLCNNQNLIDAVEGYLVVLLKAHSAYVSDLSTDPVGP